jgi:type III secretion protein Q
MQPPRETSPTGNVIERPCRPYPYARWPSWRRSDQQRLRRVLRALPRSFQAALAEARALLGIALEIREGTAELRSAELAAELLTGPLLAIWLERGIDAHTCPVLCELSPELGASLVDRVLGGDGACGHPAGRPLDELSGGVLGYLAARLCAASGGQLRARAVLDDSARVRELLGPERVLIWPLCLERAGNVLGTLRVFIAEPAAVELAAHAPSGFCASAGHVRAVPLRLCAHLGRACLMRSELAALSPGDVVIPERSSLLRSVGGLAGHAELHVLGSRQVLWRCVPRGSDLLLDSPATLEENIAMSETKRIDLPAVLGGDGEPLGDAPVELCLELARFTLRLDELSALRRGEVLSTGRAIGERVLLSAGGRAVAHGELVDVDGEIGVRIADLVRG